MFRNKQPDKTEYSDIPEHPRQMLEILAKLDEVERKLDTLIDFGRLTETILLRIEQRIQPVEILSPFGLPPVDEPAVDEPETITIVASGGKLKRKFYQHDPVGYVERKIYNSTSSHKNATCISLSALLTNVNTPRTTRRPTITAEVLVRHVMELLNGEKIFAVKSTRTSKVLAGDIAFIMADQVSTLPNRYSVISNEDAAQVLNLFARWSANG